MSGIILNSVKTGNSKDILDTLRVFSVGSLASEVLRQSSEAILMGNTSKGLFVRFENEQIVFISRESYRGPLTVTLTEPDLLPMVEPGVIRVHNSQILLCGNVSLDLQNAMIWKCDPIPTDRVLTPDWSIACGVGNQAIEDQKTDLPVSQLPYLINWTGGYNIADSRWNNVFTSAANRYEAGYLKALDGIVGYGRGLTPSGDDFILGYLLGVARYGSVLGWSGANSKRIYQQLRQSLTKTTLISQQLIKAASNGEADERLISAFDGWMYQTMDDRQIYSLLKTWGNSSGLDAFTGWVSALIMKGLFQS